MTLTIFDKIYVIIMTIVTIGMVVKYTIKDIRNGTKLWSVFLGDLLLILIMIVVSFLGWAFLSLFSFVLFFFKDIFQIVVDSFKWLLSPLNLF